MVNCPVEIALLTDSHNHPMDHVLDSLNRHKPEIICIAGDFVRARLPKRGHKMKNSRHARRFLKACAKIAPTYVSLGNHEWMLNSTDLKILASTGVRLLNNTYTSFRAGQKNVVIGGLSSGTYVAYQNYCSYLIPEELEPGQIYPPMRPVDDMLRQSSPSTDWLKAFCDEEGYKILLCHHPEYYPEYLSDQDIRPGLICSGTGNSSHAYFRRHRRKSGNIQRTVQQHEDPQAV